MFLLKVSEIPDLMSQFWQLGDSVLSWARFRRADFIGPEHQDITTSVKARIAELATLPVSQLDGDVFMLVNLRYLGIYFSPLNLYYLRQDGKFRFMLAEVSNTPWNERHYYLQDLQDVQSHPKAFHVSPFNSMAQDYRWKIVAPDAEHDRCSVNIECLDQLNHQQKIFDATLALRRLALNQVELGRVLARTPVQTLKIVSGIYWQALKLFLKKTPLYRHPRKLAGASKEGAA